ncbi:phosphate regulon transcriptional regulator PhoB [soil metagenome]
MAKILVVEDDEALAEMLVAKLQELGHTIEFATNGADAKQLLEISDYDLLLLDWSLPEISGIELCRFYRGARGQAPILFLTGKTSLLDKEEAFFTGTDDYLTKPFHLKEVMLRVAALLRRGKELVPDLLRVADLELDSISHKVKKGGKEIELFPKDFALLEFFLRHPNVFFSAEELLDKVWKSTSTASAATVRQSVMRLRKEVGNDGVSDLITNVHGVGYKLNADQQH